MYIIQRNPDDTENDVFSPYKGGIVLLNKKPWYVTNIQGPTIFNTWEEADQQVQILKTEYPDNTFKITLLKVYLDLVTGSNRLDQKIAPNRWIKKMQARVV